VHERLDRHRLAVQVEPPLVEPRSVSSESTSAAMRVISWSASSSATYCSVELGGAPIARSTVARITVSGVLSSWLASA
jgi:hypothetical protein